MISKGGAKRKEKVKLNVYDLQKDHNYFAHSFGFGVYHSGIQVHGTEFTFGQGGGIFSHEPLQAGAGGPSEVNQCVFRETIELGETTFTLSEIQGTLIPKLRDQYGFVGQNYHLLQRNCNHFSEALAKMLLNSNKNVLPGWVNRAASWGSSFSYFFSSSSQQQQQQITVNENQVFSGKGRTLKVQADTNLTKSQTVITTNTTTTTTAAAATTRTSSPSQVTELTPEQRRQKMLEATMNRLQNNNG